MFRCTDCFKEYAQNPGYCDCGNDQFEEIIDSSYSDDGYDDNAAYTQSQEQQYYDDSYDSSSYEDDDYSDSYDDGYEEEEYVPVPKLKKRPRKKQEKKKKVLTTMDKVGIGVFAVCIILSIFAFIFIGGNKSSANKDASGKPLLVKDYSIPVDINKIWDNSLPASAFSAEKIDPNKILNTKLNSIDSEMNAYLISLAQAMIDGWDRNGISGNGVTQLEFLIQSDGTLAGKKIYKFSGNKSLDNSVGKIITAFSKFQVPPSSYNQEIIIISFSAKNGSMKAYYPNVKVK